jgi:D-glycero-D-manno-heptose 1,7-bisphosphate phosphatase
MDPTPAGPRAVFFDRDDTLIRNIPYLNDPARVELMPGARPALLDLQQAGLLLFIVSNQSGIGRGLCTLEQVHAVNAEMCRQLAPVTFTAIYFSPHVPGEPSDTRKPAPGLLLQAREAYGLDLARSFFVGDKELDVMCGRNAGTRTVWLAHDPDQVPRPNPDFTATSLAEAAAWILAAVVEESRARA